MATPANINTLNQYAKGLFQETSNPLADFLAPVVPTGAATFSIIDYAQRSSFQVPSAKRAIGGDSTAVIQDGERVSITLNPYALHDVIDNHELDLATTGEGSRILRQARTKNLVSQAGNSRLNETLTVMRAGVSATAQVWGSGDSPIEDIDAEMEAIANETGMLPNRVVFNLGAWSIFKNHADTISRYPGANKVNPNINDVGSLFLNPNAQCMVSTALTDTPLKGASTKAKALATEVWIYFAEPNANQFDNSAFKTFRVKMNPFGRVRVSQKDFGEKLITEWTEAAYVNNADNASRLTVTTS